jgi:hypothetical protein
LKRNQIVLVVFEFKPVGDIFWLMKRVGKIVIYLASGLALNASLQAGDVLLPNNPYTPIVAHNMFGLNPPQTADASADVNPPPKITPTGIMTIFGSRQVLFTVDATSKPGQPPGKSGSYILSEGQRQDDIEVTRINEKSGVVTFNNHGVVQEIPLIKAPAITTTPTMPTSITVNSGPSTRTVAPVVNGGNNDGNLRASPTRGGGSTQQSQQLQQSQNTLTREAQIISMEVTRQLTADDVRAGKMPPLPPTPLTEPDAPGYVPMPPMPGQ